MTAAGDFAPHLASLTTALERLAAALRNVALARSG